MDGNAGRGKSARVFHGCITIFVIVFRLGWSAWRAVKGPGGGVYHTRQRSRALARGGTERSDLCVQYTTLSARCQELSA